MDRCALLRDVSTHWNSTFDMLTIALKYRKAIDLVSADRDLQLQPYELNTTEWKIAQQLHDILKVSLCVLLFNQLLYSLACQILKDATLFFSCSIPNLATIIPTMDILDERLTSDSLNHTRFDMSIHMSLRIAKRTPNRYYNMTDSSEVYRIAMGESY